MTFKCLNGKTININISKYKIKTKEKCRSKFQFNVGQWLKKQYRQDIILEEVYIKYENIYLDFFIPHLKLVVEVQGDQHKTFTLFFHKNIINFNKQKERDRKKKEWCALNNLKFVEIHSESELGDG